MTKLLASIRSTFEARQAIAGGADIIDLKEPAKGALGRLPDATICEVLEAVDRRRPTSATIGDMELSPPRVLDAVRRMSATGVDIVKFGMFGGDAPGTLAALAAVARSGVRLVAVLFADRHPDFDLIELCADAGLYGIMLDTADKRGGSLTAHVSWAGLARFVRQGRSRGLLTGLAGSLSAEDVPDLLTLSPDYLGFRSALATGGRAGELEPSAVVRLRSLLDGGSRRSATAAAGAQSAASEDKAPSAADTMISNP
ncbi:MAG TPA: (5-formylfuran-3-yl)methyl phosphate synthase [Alphaproteobacteria bacterium]|nr:(5-formylfuran-3-yl)methyl phosphate synthase [Alphaproteobacteria bacterium]